MNAASLRSWGVRPPVGAIWRQNQCRLRARIAAYAATRLEDSVGIIIDDAEGTRSVAFRGGQWECRWQTAPVADRPDAVALDVTFRLLAGEASQIVVSVECVFSGWSTDNYVLLPGAVYNGNRYRAVRMDYSPKFDDPEYHRSDLPITINDVPRLNIGAGESLIEEQTGNLSTPAMGFQSPSTRRGFWVLTEQRTRFGNLGLSVRENGDRSEAIFRISSPCVRRQRATINGRVPSADTAADWRAGDELSLRLRLDFFPAPAVQDLFNRFLAIRKDVMTVNALPHVLPWSAAFEIITRKFNDYNWQAEGFYSVAPGGMHQLGWVGGGTEVFALLFAGDPRLCERARSSLDFAFRTAQSPSGLFYGVYQNGKWHGDGGTITPLPCNMHLIRREGDLLYFLTKAFLLLRQTGHPAAIPASWENGVRRQADALVAIWNRSGQFGQWVDVETGEIVVGGSSSGSIIPAGLALAGEYFREPKYREVAEAAAAFYYQRDVVTGVTTGGPGDCLQAPDCESAFNMLESLVALYEITGDKTWLTRAEAMATQCASWIVSYDYTFPSQSTFAKLAIQTTGCVWASAQNKCAVPGLCTISGDCLFKLFRATGNRTYLELIHEIAHAGTQCLSRADRPMLVAMKEGPPKNMAPGWKCERVQMGDWEIDWCEVGEVFNGSCYWCEVSDLLIWCEVPGLYVQWDTGLVWALDHIQVKATGRRGGVLQAELSNPTRFPANVRVLAESSVDARRPLGWNSLWGRPVVVLAPGESKVCEFGKEHKAGEVRR